MTHGSLFSGIGGFDLAAEWMGWENKFHCEWNEFGQKVLNYYWPNAESFHDITKTNFTKYAGAIDIISGGFPCQPYSVAGKRKGKEDERHLWPEMLRAIQEIQPRWVVGENVRGLISWNRGLVFHEVQADLEAAGYEVQPFLLPACGVNAPHRRDRIWFVAHANNKGGSSRLGQVQEKDGEISQHDAEFGNSSDRVASNTNGIRRNNGSNNWEERQISHNKERNTEESKSEWSGRVGGVGQICGDGDASNSDSKRLERRIFESRENEFAVPKERKSVNSINSRSNTWDNFPTVSPVRNGDDGLSTQLDGITFSKWRNESIKAGGNAIVPQVAFQIFKAIQAYEDGNS